MSWLGTGFTHHQRVLRVRCPVTVPASMPSARSSGMPRSRGQRSARRRRAGASVGPLRPVSREVGQRFDDVCQHRRHQKDPVRWAVPHLRFHGDDACGMKALHHPRWKLMTPGSDHVERVARRPSCPANPGTSERNPSCCSLASTWGCWLNPTQSVWLAEHRSARHVAPGSHNDLGYSGWSDGQAGGSRRPAQLPTAPTTQHRRNTQTLDRVTMGSPSTAKSNSQARHAGPIPATRSR